MGSKPKAGPIVCNYPFTTRGILMGHISVNYQRFQFVTCKEVRERFSNHLWIDVVSKCDLLQEAPAHLITEDGEEDDLEMARYRKAEPDGAIPVSVKSELKSKVNAMLLSQLAKIKSEKAIQES